MFQNPKLTNAGKALFYENMSGEQIVFTTIKLGSGELTQPIAAMTDLISPEVVVDASTTAEADYVEISGTFANTELAAGFYWREVGVFAANPVAPDDRSQDILYCYQNAYDTADYIPTASVETIEKHICVPVIVGDAANVVCNLQGSLINASLQDIANHNTSSQAHQDIRQLLGKCPQLDSAGISSGGLEGQILVKAGEDETLAKWGPWPSNPNLAINTYFADKNYVVNQRNKETYGSNVFNYCIDMLTKTANINVYVADDYLEIAELNVDSAISGGYQHAAFVIPKSEYLIGQYITVSVLGKQYENDGTLCVGNTDQGVEIPVTEKYGVTTRTVLISSAMIDPSSNVLPIRLYPSGVGAVRSGKYQIIALKAELGLVSTLAHKVADETVGYDGWVLNDPPPDYTTELAKCQRYLKPLRSDFYYLGWLNQGGVTIHLPTDVLLNMGNATPSILVVDTTDFQIGVDGNDVRKTLIYGTDFTVGITQKHVILNLTSSGSSKLADLKSCTVGVWKSKGRSEFLLSNEP